MTPEEGRAVAMLQRVRFGMHRASRRFAVWLGNQEMYYELTEPQRAFLWQIAYTFRGQLPPDMAAAAERMRPWSEQHYAARLAAASTRAPRKTPAARKETAPADVVLVPGVPGRRIVVVTLFDDPAMPGIFIR
jgi:hypothetical protein